jgi:uncharacterized protein YdhG (YjbR/CyaY superfamily)
MRSDAVSVGAYLAQLPADRRQVVAEVLETVRRHVPPGYTETMAWGMITWSVPLERYPNTYNGEPLGYAALAAQKHHYALYLMSTFMDPLAERDFRGRWEAAGRKLDMGKSCLRFRKIDDLNLDLVGEVIAATPLEEFLATYERQRAKVKPP